MMGEAKPTPGPWIVRSGAKGWGHVMDREGRSICAYGSTAFTPDERVATARLIAAAPEMLAALKSLCEADRDELNDGTSDVWNQAIAAINKAEGRTS